MLTENSSVNITNASQMPQEPEDIDEEPLATNIQGGFGLRSVAQEAFRFQHQRLRKPYGHAKIQETLEANSAKWMVQTTLEKFSN